MHFNFYIFKSFIKTTDKRFLLLFCFLTVITCLNAQEAIKLFSGKAPGSEQSDWKEQENTSLPGIRLVYNITEPKQPVELHVYENKEHGYGMRMKRKSSGNWANDFESWLRNRKLIK
jgi:hypothetical protein